MKYAVLALVPLLSLACSHEAPPPAQPTTTTSATSISPRFEVRFVDSAKYIEGQETLAKATGDTGPSLTQADVASAVANGPTVLINLNEGAAARFGQATKDNVGRRMAIIVDGKVQAAPIVNTEVDAKHFEITLRSADEATRLAYALTPQP